MSLKTTITIEARQGGSTVFLVEGVPTICTTRAQVFEAVRQWMNAHEELEGTAIQACYPYRPLPSPDYSPTVPNVSSTQLPGNFSPNRYSPSTVELSETEEEEGQREVEQGGSGENSESEEVRDCLREVDRKIEEARRDTEQKITECQAQINEVNQKVRNLAGEITTEVVRRREALESDLRNKTRKLYKIEREIIEKKRWAGQKRKRKLPEQDWWPGDLTEGVEVTVLRTTDNQLQLNLRARRRGRGFESSLTTVSKELVVQEVIRGVGQTIQLDVGLRDYLTDQLYRFAPRR